VNAYLWHVDDNLRHHLRAESIADVRERIAATHGDAIARQAVIKPLPVPPRRDSEQTAA
jgi:hypothetical protein